jgi:hypothetical protein
MPKPKCPDYSEECHRKVGVVFCRDKEHDGKVRCPVVRKEEEE